MLNRLACAAVVVAALTAGCDPSATPLPDPMPSASPTPTPTPTPSPQAVRPGLTVGPSRGELRSAGFTLSVLVGAPTRPTDARSARHQLVLGDDASR